MSVGSLERVESPGFQISIPEAVVVGEAVFGGIFEEA